MTITATYDTLLRQAPYTANVYLENAVKDIDDELVAGYAKAHPELIAAYMKVAGDDYNNATLIVCIQEATESIGRIVDVFSEYVDRND